MQTPFNKSTPNTWAFLRDAMITPTGFREYDARWKYPDDINIPGITALGLGLGTQMYENGIAPVIAVGNDYRDYSLTIKNALMLGLIQAGIHVKGISFDGMPLGGGNPKNSFNGLMPLRKTLRLVIKKCGSKGADVLVDAVVVKSV